MKQRNPQLKIRLEPEAKAWLESKAKADERSQSWLINSLVKEAMRRDKQTTAKK